MRFPGILATILITLIATGCESGVSDPPPAPRAAATDTPPGNAADSTGALYAEGWSEVVINANFAKTTVDHIAHFATTRNACGRDAFGVLELTAWNNLTQALNEAIKTEPLAEPRCQTLDEYSKMDGTAEVTFEGGKRLLFEVRGYYDVCTTIKDLALSAKLLQAITSVVLLADKEDCSLVR